MIKKATTIFIFLIAISLNSQQKKINNYKYVIVPEKFDFLKHINQYETSSLTKFLLKKNGLTVFISNETLPEDLMKNRCLGLTANVIDDSGMFTVKNIIQLKDCNNNVIYTSKVGKSKEKDYKKGYHEAIRNAHASMDDIQYSYKPLEESSIKKEEEVVKQEIIVPVKKVLPVKKEIPVKIVNGINTVIPDPITKDNSIKTDIKFNTKVLYAQAIENGFQLVNTKPALVFKVLKTKVKDVFIIKDKNGILYKNEDVWVAEYYNNTTLVVEKYQIKF